MRGAKGRKGRGRCKISTGGRDEGGIESKWGGGRGKGTDRVEGQGNADRLLDFLFP